MSALAFMAALIVGLLLAETRLSRVHEAALRARGAILPPGDPYRALALLYPTAFVAMIAEGVCRVAMRPVPDISDGPSWFAAGLVLFAASKALKYWAIHSLGERWSFRVFIVPGLPLVAWGPYRYVSHPNYIAVVGELVSAAMMMQAIVTGPLMTLAFGAALWARIRFESQVLRSIGASTSATLGRETS
jgi:methyltransferase